MEDSTTINLGIVGLGMAGLGAAHAAEQMENVRLVAAADTNEQALAAFEARFGASTYTRIEEICNDARVDTLWIATPNAFHRPHTVLAANAGKHVIVEKPMAVTLDEAKDMIEAADRNGVQLICGGSKSSSVVVRKMREIVRNGDLGPLRTMMTWASTDWLLRPRRPDEYDLEYGGGVVFRQAPHQVDSMRLLAGGVVRSVRGITGQWMASRDAAPGAYSALLEFENGVFGTLIYNAHGYFMAAELFTGAGGPNAFGTDSRLEARRSILSGARSDVEAKTQRNSRGVGRAIQAAGAVASSAPRYLQDLGLLVVCCEHGEMRQSPNGIYVYGDEETTEVALTEDREAYSPELEELHEHLVTGKAILHDGRWGLATTEVLLGVMQSSREHCDVQMQCQVRSPDWA